MANVLDLYIDAGHGPNTAGKRSPDGTLREFNFNNPTAKKLAAIMKEYEGVTTYFTYKENEDTPLKTRTNTANALAKKSSAKNKAFVSIHGNASGNEWSSAHGLETFVYTTKPAASVKLATNVEAGMVKQTGLTDRGVKTDNLHVVRETTMPAILVEGGFMTNKEEAALMKTAAFQQKIAQGIADGLAKTYGLKKKAGSSKPTPPPSPTPAPAKTAAKTSASSSKTIYRVQVGAFADKKNAEGLVSELKKKGYAAIITE